VNPVVVPPHVIGGIGGAKALDVDRLARDPHRRCAST
jgi:hypothetical protein